MNIDINMNIDITPPHAYPMLPPGPSAGGPSMGGGGDINIHIDINMNIDIHVIINKNIEYYIDLYTILSSNFKEQIKI